MIIEQFINDKINQLTAYIKAVNEHELHYTELDQFIHNTMAEWTLLNVTDETPRSAKERVLWHIIYEISLHGSQALEHNLFLKSEIKTCNEFLMDVGSYPIDCVGWRPLA